MLCRRRSEVDASSSGFQQNWAVRYSSPSWPPPAGPHAETESLWWPPTSGWAAVSPEPPPPSWHCPQTCRHTGTSDGSRIHSLGRIRQSQVVKIKRVYLQLPACQRAPSVPAWCFWTPEPSAAAAGSALCIKGQKKWILMKHRCTDTQVSNRKESKQGRWCDKYNSGSVCEAAAFYLQEKLDSSFIWPLIFPI